MQSWWKNPRFIGNSAYWAFKFLRYTLRIKFYRSGAIDTNKPYLFAFWHGKQLLPALVLTDKHDTKRCVMVSPSRDGAMLTVFLHKLGYEIIRGSSRDNNVQALLATKNKLENGASIGFAIDGPIGPIHVIKPGIIYLAQKCGAKIIPIGSAFSKHWIFNKAWDKFELPKPFSKAALVLGDPLTVDPEQDVKSACRLLEQQMLLVQQKAIGLL